jgi:hypothetical protein
MAELEILANAPVGAAAVDDYLGVGRSCCLNLD